MNSALSKTLKQNADQKTAPAPAPETAILTLSRFDLIITADERNKIKAIVKDQPGAVIFSDVFKVSESAKRTKFINDLSNEVTLTDDEKKAIQIELLKYTEFVTVPVGDGETVETSFQVLSDHRIIEQIRTGFAFYDQKTDHFEIVESFQDSEITYKKIDDELFTKLGGLSLADNLTEYGTDAQLLLEIEDYLKTYADLRPIHRKICALYVFLSYIADKLNELSYLMPTGDPGSGKSRIGGLLVSICRRGLTMTSPSAASLYRVVDQFAPTLFLDEFNMSNSEDTQAIIQILNAGFQRLTKIPRMMPNANGTYKTELFSPFCPKIIGALSKSHSDALNSRCVQIEMQRTQRQDIPFAVYSDQIEKAQDLRNKLTLWRLRNFHQNFDERLKQAEIEMKKLEIMPRLIQANLPLVALISDENVKQEFFSLLKDANKVHHADKLRTIEGEIAQALHFALFDVEEIDNQQIAKLKINQPEENELCSDLNLEKILAIINNERKERDAINSKYLGRKLSAMNIQTSKFISRKSDFYQKRAIIFDSENLASVFNNYALPVPPDFVWKHWKQFSNSNQNNDLECFQEDQENNSRNSFGSTLNNTHTTLNETASNASKRISENREALQINKNFVEQVI